MDIKREHGLEVWRALDVALDENPVGEQDIITLAEAGGIDLGDNPKSRLNYLTSLFILRKPEPALYGKGKGGTRFFQRDALEILEFVHEQKDHYAFNEIRDILMERRRDLVHQACRELNIEKEILEHNSVIKLVSNVVNAQCHFNYLLIKGKVLVFKLTGLFEDRMEARHNVETLESCQKDLTQDLCADCGSIIDRYIQAKKHKVEQMTEILKRDIKVAEKLLEEIKA